MILGHVATRDVNGVGLELFMVQFDLKNCFEQNRTTFSVLFDGIEAEL